MILEVEIWRPVIGYEGIYEVSNFGRVKSLSRIRENGIKGYNSLTKERFLKEEKIKKGYKRVILSKNGKSKRFLIHRLVAASFLDNPMNKEEVNHIDGNKGNNFLGNLEWCTRLENMIHAKEIGLIKSQKGELNILSKLKECQVKEIRLLREKGFKLKDLSEKFNVSLSTISKISNGDLWGGLK